MHGLCEIQPFKQYSFPIFQLLWHYSFKDHYYNIEKIFLKNPKIARFWLSLFSWFMKTMHWMFISSGKSYEIVQCLVLLLISLILKSVFNWCSAICFQLFELSYCFSTKSRNDKILRAWKIECIHTVETCQ